VQPSVVAAHTVSSTEHVAEPQHAILIRGLTKTFPSSRGGITALDGIDLSVGRGEFVCVVGPSGCGKTTLLNVLASLDQATAGTVEFRRFATDQPLLSVVFQEQGVFPWRTVLDNAAFGLEARGVAKRERLATALELVHKLGLAGFEHAYPRQLSGGMRQRVNIARAFANDPEVLLMDEPFASLDEQMKLILQDRLLHLWEERRKTVLFITHSLDEAIRLADRIVVMTARPGRVKAVIPVDLPRPRNVFELQASPTFTTLRARVWDALAEEVLAVQRREEDRAP
jgi:NitT/TauT family transport system ATP-binding protein